MAIVVKYINTEEATITEQQASQMSEFKKIIEIDGKIKRIDEYYENKVNYISYYIDIVSETDVQVLRNIKLEVPYSDCIVIIEPEPYGVYTILNYRKYLDDDSTPILHRDLLDANGQGVCSESTTEGELFALDPTLQRESHIRKYFHSETIYNNNIVNEEGIDCTNFLVFEAIYKVNGDLKYIDFNPNSTYDREGYDLSNYNELISRCGFDTVQSQYYLNDIFLPLGSIV